MQVDNTGVIDIRVVRLWLDTREEFVHNLSCSTKLLAGFDDDGVYLFCLECNDRIYVGLDTYLKMKGELNV
jgi:hypothetical protein